MGDNTAIYLFIGSMLYVCGIDGTQPGLREKYEINKNPVHYTFCYY